MPLLILENQGVEIDNGIKWDCIKWDGVKWYGIKLDDIKWHGNKVLSGKFLPLSATVCHCNSLSLPLCPFLKIRDNFCCFLPLFATVTFYIFENQSTKI